MVRSTNIFDLQIGQFDPFIRVRSGLIYETSGKYDSLMIESIIKVSQLTLNISHQLQQTDAAFI